MFILFFVFVGVIWIGRHRMAFKRYWRFSEDSFNYEIIRGGNVCLLLLPYTTVIE